MSQDWDEIASAHIDGEATLDEVARLEADPDGLTALHELRQVAAANADVPAPPPELRRQQLGAALDLFDQLAGADGDVHPSDTIVTSAHSTAADQGAGDAAPGVVLPLRRRRAMAWIGSVAAAVVVVAGVGVAVSGLDTSSGGGDESAEVAPSPSAEALVESSDAPAADAATDMTAARADMTENDAGEEQAEDGDTTTFADAEEDAAPPEVALGLAPVAELGPADDLFAAADQLMAGELPSGDVAAATLDERARLEVRCPTSFEGFDDAVAAPILFDGVPALFVATASPVDRYLVITSECVILAADQQP